MSSTSEKNIEFRMNSTLVLCWLWAFLTYALGAPLAVSQGLDTSWAALLADAFLQGQQFGSEVIFTFGPWGFLFEPTGDHRIYWWSLLGRGVLGLGMATGVAFLGCRYISNLWLRLAWCGVIIALADPIVLTPVVFFLIHFEEEENLFVSLALAVAAGLAMQTKFTSFVLTVPLLLLILLNALRGSARARREFLAAIGSFLFFWLLAGQRLPALFDWLQSSLAIVAGYSDSMSSMPPGDSKMLAGTLLCALMPSLYLLRWLRMPSLEFLMEAGWVAVYALMTWKHAYVRNEEVHTWWGILNSMLPAALCFAPVLAASEPLRNLSLLLEKQQEASRRSVLLRLSASTMLCITALACGMACLSYVMGAPDGGVLVRSLAQWRWKLQQLPATLAGSSPAATPRQVIMQPWIPDSPLTRARKVKTDIFPVNGGLLYQFGIPYHWRPIPHTYSVYTASLLKTNEDFLQRPDAPEQILFRLDPIDGRYPAQEDSLAMMKLFEHYQIEALDGDYLLMKRVPARPAVQRQLLTTRRLKLGEAMELPISSSGPVWAEIEVLSSLSRKLMGAAFRPPRLRLKLRVDPKDVEYRLVSGVSSAGFLLSPFLPSTLEFALLHMGEANSEMVRPVRSFSVEGVDPLRIGTPTEVLVRLYQAKLPAGSAAPILPTTMRQILQVDGMKPDIREGEVRAFAIDPRVEVAIPATNEAFTLSTRFGVALKPMIGFGRTPACPGDNKNRIDFRILLRNRNNSSSTTLHASSHRTNSPAQNFEKRIDVPAGTEPRDVVLQSNSGGQLLSCMGWWAAPVLQPQR
jgi:hypothetical protein